MNNLDRFFQKQHETLPLTLRQNGPEKSQPYHHSIHGLMIENDGVSICVRS